MNMYTAAVAAGSAPSRFQNEGKLGDNRLGAAQPRNETKTQSREYRGVQGSIGK